MKRERCRSFSFQLIIF